MKRYATALLFVILLNAAVLHSQKTTSNAYAYGYFLAPDGHLALVTVIRTQLPTLTRTELFYTFCGQTNLGVSCQRGDGLIPNSALVGRVLFDRTKPDVLRLAVNTSAIVGYQNQLCTQGIDDFDHCLGEVVGPGGVITITWTRTNEWANLATSTNSRYEFGRLVNSGSSKLGVFSAHQTGTMIGAPAGATNAVMTTSTDTGTLQDKFVARKAAIVKQQR